MIPQSVIALEIKNNTNYNLGVLLMNGLFNPNNQANAKEFYDWNLALETFVGVNYVTLQYYIVGNPNLQIVTVALQNKSVAGVAATLSTLNLGFFFSAANLVYTYNANFVFSDIVLS